MNNRTLLNTSNKFDKKKTKMFEAVSKLFDIWGRMGGIGGHSDLSDLKYEFDFFADGTPLIDRGSHFLRICRRNHSKWSNMSQKMASAYRSWYFSDFV